jgi:hypothetical protein
MCGELMGYWIAVVLYYDDMYEYGMGAAGTEDSKILGRSKISLQ